MNYHCSESFIHFTYFEAISSVKTKKKPSGGGGLSPPGKNQNRNQFVFFSFGVDSLNWQSFIEISKMACNATSRCSRGHALNSITVIGARISLQKLDKSVGLRQSSITVIY